ncbi:MAG: hypothetical protein ABI548_11615 [Polyangiaceae bacterium]
MATLESIQRAVSELGRRGRGRSYPKALRADVVQYALARRAVGIRIQAIGEELGVPWRTVRGWMPSVRAERFRRIEVVVPRAEGVVVHGPHGVRIEGLDLDGVAELLRRLG